MSRQRLALFVLLVVLGQSLVACQGARIYLPDGVSPVQATWLYGKFIIPSAYAKSGETITYRQTVGQPHWDTLAASDVKPNASVPVVLYMHGCRGMHGQARRYSKLLESEGYAVFMPDSFKRPYRRECREQGTLEERVLLRKQEVEYALDRIRGLSWVNQKRVMLMGFSEGGNTTDSWSKPGFAAHLVMGSACTLVDGKPAAPAGVPVLAIVGAQDRYRPGFSCRIEREDGISRSIVIKGAGHTVAQYPETKEAIRAFLGKCCS